MQKAATEKVPLNLIEVILAQGSMSEAAVGFPSLALHRPGPPATRRKSLSMANTALKPLPDSERLFGWRDHAALWLSLGVGLLVMQVGSYLMPALGTQAALAVILAGSVLGAGLLAWTEATRICPAHRRADICPTPVHRPGESRLRMRRSG